MPNVPVVVIVGAGASLAAADFTPLTPPPLTNTLFDNPRSDEILPKYVMAQKAARFIRREMTRDKSLSFEAALLSLRTSDNDYMKHVALSVPLYLQDLLLSVSADLSPFAERYDALTLTLSGLPDVLYVSLNYDTLLDTQLTPFHPISGFDDYIDPSRRWSLIKPHGSVNWSYRTEDSFNPMAPPADLVIYEDQIQFTPIEGMTLASVRTDAGGGQRLYPAMAMPEGPKDRLVMPHSHSDFLQSALHGANQLDVLVLGYSALDIEILQLIKDSQTPVRRMTVVNRNAESALEVFSVIHEFGVEPIWADVYDGSYAEWIDTGAVRVWAEEYGGLANVAGAPYPSLTSPEDVQHRIATRAASLTVRPPTAPPWRELEALSREQRSPEDV